MADYARLPQPMIMEGLDLAPVPDMPTRPGRFPVLLNVEQIVLGEIRARAGQTRVTASPAGAAIHSLARLNDPRNSSWTRIVGAGTSVLRGQTAPAAITDPAGGTYSANPKTFVVWRPTQDVDPWLYIGDSGKMRKVSRTSNAHQIGLPRPVTAPTPELGQPIHREVEYGASASWGAAAELSGSPGTPAAASDARINTTIVNPNGIFYDSGNTGWCSIRPVAMTNFTPGAVVTIGAEAGIEVRDVLPGSTSFANVQLRLMTGSPGFAILTKNTGVSLGDIPIEAKQNSLVSIDDGFVVHFHRVLAAGVSEDGARWIQIGGYAGLEGNVGFQVRDSIRCYTTTTRAVGNAITANAVEYTFTGAGVAAVTRTVARDLSAAAVGSTSVSIGPDDWMAANLYVQYPEFVSEIKVQLETDAASMSFVGNRFEKAIRADELIAVATGEKTQEEADRTQIERNVLDRLLSRGTPFPLAEMPSVDPTDTRGRYDDPYGQSQEPVPYIPAAQEQWISLKWRLKDMVRFGNDDSRTLKNVRAIRLHIALTGATVIRFGSWIVKGGYEPDVSGLDLPYFYCYQARASSTGAVSPPSGPAIRHLTPSREGVSVTIPAYSAATEADKIDVYRFGGSVDMWKYIGSVAVAGGAFVDRFSDTYAARGQTLDEDIAMPFMCSVPPKSGNSWTVTGNILQLNANTFDAPSAGGTFAPGMVVRFGNNVGVVRSRQSATRVELNQFFAYATGSSWEIPEPLVEGRPLPVLIGPFDDRVFGLGDPDNAGRLYWMNGNNPDATRQSNWIDVTSPADPLMNGVVWNDRLYVWSTNAMFMIVPARGTPQQYEKYVVPGGRGLAARYALAAGELMWWLGRDGIYQSDGGAATNITDEALRPLFPRGNETNGSNVGIIEAPDMQVNATSKIIQNVNSMRLSYDGTYLNFDYLALGGVYRTLRKRRGAGWTYHEYGYPVRCRLAEDHDTRSVLLGGNDGHLYVEAEGARDHDADIACAVTPFYFHAGDLRSEKQFGDNWFDVDPNGGTITVTVGRDNHTATESPVNLTGASRAVHIVDLNSGEGRQARNISAAITWNRTATTNPKLYVWEPSWLPHPEDTIRRATDWTPLGYYGRKLIRGIIVDADTGNVSRSIKVQCDGADAATITVQHNGRIRRFYNITSPFEGYLLRLLPNDGNEWKLYSFEFVYDQHPDKGTITPEWDDLDSPGAKYVKGLIVEADTDGASVTGNVDSDDQGLAVRSITLTHADQSQIAYSFEPFITHLVRLRPGADCKVFKIKWIWEEEPELILKYPYSQQTTFGHTGFKHCRKAHITLLSNAAVTLKINVDGTEYTYTLTSTGGVRATRDINLPPLKGRVYRFELESASQFRLYKNDCAIEVKPWGTQSSFRPVNPFGGMHRNLDGAFE